MSKSQSSYLKYRGYYLSIAAAILLMFAVFFTFSTPSEKPVLLRIKVVPTSAVVSGAARSLEVPVFDSESYYRTIIDNNLFRPLGWTSPRPKEPYRLLGTIVSPDADTPPQAILQTTVGNTTRIVVTGEKLDPDTAVVDIQPKQVTLSTKGQQRTLKLNAALWLNTSHANRFPVRRSPPAPTARETTDTYRRIGLSKSRTPAQTAAPAKKTPVPHQYAPLSEWQTSEGEPIRMGDARLKNPKKWGLRRR
ncbi:MAG: hypothetical protein OXN27_25610 [Candidatus Poribacteria bacterium]|nr:hypothetical protein [Candidatus Poribacteria bacterium]